MENIEKNQTKQTVLCRVIRDIWDGAGERQREGSEIMIPFDDAIDMVEAGAVARVKVQK